MVLINLAVIRPRRNGIQRVPLAPSDIYKNVPYMFIVASSFLACMGIYIPFFHLPSYGHDVLDLNDNNDFSLVPILNVGSFIGRIGAGYVSDKLRSPLLISTICLLFCSILGFAWISIKNWAATVVFCIFYGMFSGAWIALVGPVVASVAPSLEVVGALIGLSFGTAAFGLLIGNPIAGIILNAQSNSYRHLQEFTGIVVIVSTVLLGSAFILKERKLTR
jgi:MFS family permease